MPYQGFRQIFGPLIRGKTRQVIGQENLPSSPPFIIAANHNGFLDSLALTIFNLGKYNRPTWFITSPLMWRIWGAYLARHWLCMVPLRRQKSLDSLEEISKKVDQGEIVGFFPEGHRNPDKKNLLPGKTGAVRLALKTGVPLIPVGLVNNTGHYLINLIVSLFQKEKYIDIRVGPPLDMTEFQGRSIDKPLLEESTRKLMKTIGDLCGKQYPY